MKYTFLFSIIIVSYSATSQTFSELDLEFTDISGRINWVDIDTDGDMDFIIYGSQPIGDGQSVSKVELYINEGSDSFTLVENVFPEFFSILDIHDVNGDGYPDFLASIGFNSTSIYINKYVESSTVESSANLNDFGGDGFFSDFDNDGDVDIVFSGQKLDNGWKFITAVYRNDNGSFLTQEFDDNPNGFFAQSVKPIDIDNDGQLEIIMSGSYEEILENRKTNSETRLYKFNDNFLEKAILDTIGLIGGNINNQTGGNIKVLDVNNDGNADAVMAGGYEFQLNSGARRLTPYSQMYLNQGGDLSISQDNIFSPIIFGNVAGGDFNNDGNTEVGVTGNYTEDNIDLRLTRLFSNNAGVFSEIDAENFPDLGNGSLQWADYDNDGDLDFILSGSIDNVLTEAIVNLYKNSTSTPNSSPTAPSNLTVELVEDRYEFSWSPSTDSETNTETLTYNWYLRTETDTVISSNSFTSGKRKIVENGNLEYGNTHFLNRFMGPGDYYWSVQAIDNGFQGSPFSEEGFFHVNFPPVINSIAKSSQLEETPFEVTLDDISVTDPDSSFPDDFSIIIQGGTNYNFSGNTIAPVKDFFGDLTIPVIVEDQLDESNIYELTVTIENVNDIPEITEQLVELTTEEDTPISISLDAISVTNLDVPFPSGFTLEIMEGDNYSFENNLLTPDVDFNGTLEVPIRVNDGEDDSPIFNLEIAVTPVNDIPEIVGQVDLSTPEEAPITLSLTDISVINIDGMYPDDFSMTLNEGTNYTLSNLDVIPDVDFNGVLEIPLTVNDGQDESNQFILEIEITPVNDIPSITGTASTLSTPEGTPLRLTINDLIIDDPDNVFPDDFILTVFDGENYVVSDNEITPVTDFVGVISVLISVSDGEAESKQTGIEIEVTKILSTRDEASERIFSIFPNPFADQLYIEVNGIDNQFTIEITTLGGQEIMILEPTETANYIDLSSMKDGIYLLKISDKGELILTQKIIKQSR